MSIDIRVRAGFPAEMSAVMNGSWVFIGSLAFNPIQIVFDNQGTAPVAISVDGGVTTWRTFPAGEAIILDMRSNAGKAANFTMDLGTPFFGNGASGTFSISYLYVQ